jgi:hypothetical protein
MTKQLLKCPTSLIVGAAAATTIIVSIMIATIV